MHTRFNRIIYYTKTILRSYCTNNDIIFTNQIKKATVVCTNHLTPEIKLHLITEECKLWNSPVDQCPFEDPFWAFYWPGGQAISRFLLDNNHYVYNKSVLDIGSGSAACSLASAIAGSSQVTANDIDPVACVAAKLNAQLNNVYIDVISKNILLDNYLKWEVIIVGDMFYSKDLANKLWKWLDSQHKQGKTILIGDPGRHCFRPEYNIQKCLKKLEEYKLTKNCCLENRGFSTASVWILD